MHGSVVLAKEITEVYYSSKPEYNYYSGCSTGGRQGLKEVEMYPEDFDGVLAGAPAWWTSHLQPVSENILSKQYNRLTVMPLVDQQARTTQLTEHNCQSYTSQPISSNRCRSSATV